MAVYRRNYQGYAGALTDARLRFFVLTRFSIYGIFDSKPFTAFAAICCVPFLLAATFIYVSHSLTARLLLHMNPGDNVFLINNYFFASYLQIEAWLGFMLIAWSGPSLIAADLANNALPLILSRPISRTEYVVGKLAVIAVLLSAITWVPCLLLFALQSSIEGHGWFGAHLWMVGSILLSAWMWIAVVGLLTLAASAWLKWRVAATALLLGIFFVGAGFGEAVNHTLHTSWGYLLNVPYDLDVIWFRLFRVPEEWIKRSRYGALPIWAAWCSLAVLCLFSLLVLNRRLKAREVVSG